MKLNIPDPKRPNLFLSLGNVYDKVIGQVQDDFQGMHKRRKCHIVLRYSETEASKDLFKPRLCYSVTVIHVYLIAIAYFVSGKSEVILHFT